MIYILEKDHDSLIAKLARARGVTVVCRFDGGSEYEYIAMEPGEEIVTGFEEVGGTTVFWYKPAEPKDGLRLMEVHYWQQSHFALADLLPIDDTPSEILLFALNLCPESTLKEIYDWCVKFRDNRFPTNDELLAYLETR